jgi:Zn-dependent protease/predicted transcriptional regulator
MFGKGVRLFRLLGFEVKIDFSWVIIALLIAWSLSTGLFPYQVKDLSTGTYWVMGIGGAIGLFLSIIAHEFSHSLVARKRGIQMKGITLFIFGGVAEMGDEPPDARSEFLMAGVGPLSSIVIAVLFYAVYRLGGAGLSVPVQAVVGYLAYINAILAGFNLVPAFPLDGGRMLRSGLWAWKKDFRWASRTAANIGSGFGVFLVVLGVLNVVSGNFIGGMWWFLIGMFLQKAAKASYERAVTRQVLQGRRVEDFMKSNPVTVSGSLSLEQFVNDYVYTYHYKMFPVTSDGGKLEGCITTKQVKGVPREEWEKTTVGEVAEACGNANSVSPDIGAEEALSRMRTNGTSRVMVVENGTLAGVLSLKDLMDFLSLKEELGDGARS